MSTNASGPVRSNDGRRMYVFTTVTLAVFVLGIVAVGYSCHGFLSGRTTVEAIPQEIVVEVPPQRTAADEARERAAAELEITKTELASAARTAQQDYARARQATAAALTEYETAQGRFLDFLGTHFGELTADIPKATTYMSAVAEHTAKERELAEQAAALERERAEQAAAKERERKAKAAELAAHPPKPPVQMVTNPEWTELRGQLEKLQEQRKKLLETLTASHPAVVAVDLEITDVEQKLQALPAQIAATAEPVQQPPAIEEMPAVAEATPEPVAEVERPRQPQPASVPAPTIDLATWATRWSTDDAQFHDLTKQLSAAQAKYRDARQQEESAQKKHVEAAAAVAAINATPAPESTPTPPAAPAVTPEPVIVPLGANPRHTILWCAVAAAFLGLAVARRAMVSEPVFRAAAAVRQALELPILGLLSRGTSQLPREQPKREPVWVRRTVLTAELWLVVIVLLLATTAFVDQQFWRDLIADPLAACSKKFFC